MTSRRPTVGLVCLGMDEMPEGVARGWRTCHEAHSALSIALGGRAELVEYPRVVSRSAEATACREFLEEHRVDGLILFHGTFSEGNLSVALVDGLAVPVAAWTIPEPPLDGSAYQCGSTVGMLGFSYAMRVMGRSFRLIRGLPSDPATRQSAISFVHAVAARFKLRTARVGLVGFRSPGFHCSGVDELALKGVIGPEVVHVSLGEVERLARSIPDAEASAVLGRLQQSGVVIGDALPDSITLGAMRAYLSLRSLQQRMELDALAVKCWPELIDGGLGVCPAFSLLADDGVMASCEGDVDGVVSMLAVQLMTGLPSFFADWVQIDQQANSVFFWHCGQAALSLAHAKHPVSLRRYHTGVDAGAMNFPLRPGRVTLLRLLSVHGRYGLFVTSGEAMDRPMLMKGTCVDVRLDAPVLDVERAIVEKGFAQHFVVAYGDIKEALQDLGQALSIEVVAL